MLFLFHSYLLLELKGINSDPFWLSVNLNCKKIESDFNNNYLRCLALPRLVCNLMNIFCFANSFQKSVFQGFRLPRPSGEWGGRGQNCTKTFLAKLQNFIKMRKGVWISISPPHTNRHTDKHLSAHFKYIEER